MEGFSLRSQGSGGWLHWFQSAWLQLSGGTIPGSLGFPTRDLRSPVAEWALIFIAWGPTNTHLFHWGVIKLLNKSSPSSFCPPHPHPPGLVLSLLLLVLPVEHPEWLGLLRALPRETALEASVLFLLCPDLLCDLGCAG